MKNTYSNFKQFNRLVKISIFYAVLSLSACGSKPPTPTQQSSPPHLTQEGPTQQVVNVNLPKEDIKAFTGTDKVIVGGHAAKIMLRQSTDEKKFLADFSCLDERECYGVYKFDKYILSKYPEIAKVKFRTPKEILGDKEEIAATKLDFRRGLYFAKELKLADGTTLFDFLTKCSKNVSPLNWAQVGYEPAQKAYIAMQFFPVLRQKVSGKEFEEDILLDRRGDQIEARSPLFSTSIFTYADFMERHGLECWRK